MTRYIPERLSHYGDYLGSVTLRGPDGFTSFDDTPVDQPAALKDAFDILVIEPNVQSRST